MVQTFELAAFQSLVNLINAAGLQWNQGIQFAHRVRYAFDPNNKLFSGTDLDSFESMIGPYLPTWHPAMGPPMLHGMVQYNLTAPLQQGWFSMPRCHDPLDPHPRSSRRLRLRLRLRLPRVLFACRAHASCK